MEKNGEATKSRAFCTIGIKIGTICRYKIIENDGTVKHCALGRLAPKANWEEYFGLDKSDKNAKIALRAMKKLGCFSGDTEETLDFAKSLQEYGHDETKYSRKQRLLALKRFYT